METENIEKPMNRMSEKYQQLQDRAREFQSRARETAKNTYDTTDTWVHDNPWTSVGIAAASALVLGLVIGAMMRGED
jgi:ElaB/YqjD/DUF883 family membrane-anchored ribosome-binding protein